MKYRFLLVICFLVTLFPSVKAQEWNTVIWEAPTPCTNENRNVMVWDESTALGQLNPCAVSGAPYGLRYCTPTGWHVGTLPSETFYNVNTHTYEREMIASSDCNGKVANYGYFNVVSYTVYTCDSSTIWTFDKEYKDWFCESGYYLALPGDAASNGHCDCKGGRLATAYPIEIGTGNMSESATDFVSGEGRLRFDRFYNSNPMTPDSGGHGWQNTYDIRHIVPLNQGAKLPPPGTTTNSSMHSTVYASASAACTTGITDIAQGLGGLAGNASYTGVTATYLGNGQCQLSNGTVVSVLYTNPALAYSAPMSDAASGVTVFRPDGASYYFSCANGSCSATGQNELALTATSSGFVLTAENGDVENYDLNGNLLKITTRDGYTQTIARNAPIAPGVPATISTVTDSYGRVLTFAYNANGQLNTLTLPDQTTVQYGYDGNNRLISVTYADGSSVGYQYTNAKFISALTAWIDEAKNTYATWTYDNTTGYATGSALAGNVDTSTLSYGTNATTLTDNLGTQRTYNYQDIAGALRLASVNGPACKDCMGQTMAYDANGFLKSAQDWNGNTTQYVYGPTGLIQQQIEADGTAVQRTTTFSWNSSLRVPLSRAVSNAAGATTSFTQWVYNGAGQVLARCEIDPTNSAANGYICSNTGTVPAGVRRWTYTYCTAVDTTQCPIVGLLLTQTGPRTDLTQTKTYSYYITSSATNCGTSGAACYQAGDLKSVTDALGHVATIASYDAAGRITRLIDSSGASSDYAYTPRGWLASRTVGGVVTKFTYTAYGAVASITDPDGLSASYTYDAAHRLTRITDALGNYVQYTLDAAGNVTQEQTFDSTGALRKRLARSFNTLGQLTQVVDGLNHTVFNASQSGSYDANGNLVQSADALGIQHKLGYDALNRLTQTIDNYNGSDAATANTTIATSRDSLDRLTGVTDPNNLTTTYQFDGLSNGSGQTSPDTGSTARTFDAAGNVLTRTDAKGITATYAYDALDRVIQVSYPDSTQNITYKYDEPNSVTGCTSSAPIGRLTRIVENAATTVLCYDVWGHPIQKQQITSTGTTTVGYSYTAAGRLSGVVYRTGSLVTYSRDGDGRIQSISVTPANGVVTTVISNITYLPFGPINGYTLGNGQAVSRTLDANYQLTDLTSPAFNLHLARDALGEITAIGNAPGANPATETYSYDPLRRLTAITEASGSLLESVTYNQTGDRLSKTGSGLATGNYSYNAGTHQLIATGSGARTVDANGNTTGVTQAGSTYGYVYNQRNRLAAVQQNQATVATYTYNARGERIAKTVGGVTTNFDYNEAGQMLGEYNGSASRDYVWLGDILVATVDASSGATAVNYVVADGLGTPRAVVNGAGTTIWQWAYQGNAWGEVVPTSNGYTLNLRFPGQYFDAESGLVNNVNRDLDSSIGRYIQSDPTGLGGGINRYAAISNSPLNRIDLDGLRDIFVGGFGDGSSGIVQGFYSTYHQKNPDSSYYSWKDEAAILKDIANTPEGDPIHLIGHSYGGDTAAKAAMKACRKVDLLITIDPVSRHRPDMQSIASSVGTWVDVDAEGGNPFQPSNFISGLGGAWNGAPSGIADSYIQDNGVNHEDFGAMMNASGPGVNSALQVLQGAPTVNSPFLSGRGGN
ncbi:YD repeat-containing protein [Burkholderia pseudomallei]|uniref:RHS repeat-associated core domain-containing protein n=1 Tax=Burkholderia pseudomallei TaxID=28450 RepID=UPI0005E2180C|nr:RHS repeat-associated core domain-containing protein [Burkholderia pseudomallei]CFU06544.1 YD repeat-containing protein [Burkholderia pseudomallei]CPI08136.1 YD repeat-containing protein [Burkholderia pseudomallei]